MNQTLDTQELAIVIAAKNHNSMILTRDFLKYSGVVPADWELARQPITTDQVAQVIFRNGVSLVAQPDRVIFLEAINAKDFQELQIPGIVRKYVETLPNVEYQGISINPRGYITTASLEQEVRTQNYIVNTLLAAGPWQEVGSAPVKASLQFAFTLERSQFNLSINEAELQLPEQETIPVVLFSGNFNYNLVGGTQAERLQSLYQFLNNWQMDMETYCDIINTKFLQSSSILKNAPQLIKPLF